MEHTMGIGIDAGLRPVIAARNLPEGACLHEQFESNP